MKGLLLNANDGPRPVFTAGHVETEAAVHNNQFLVENAACRLQLRRLLRSDLPAGAPLDGATAVLVLRHEGCRVPAVITVRADRTRIRNSRSGVMQAINRLAKANRQLAGTLRKIADAQTVWGEPD